MMPLILNILGSVVSLAIPVLTPYVLNMMRSVVHNNDVQIYMEAGVNAAGRILLTASQGLQNGAISRDSLGDYVTALAKAEAMKVATDMLPQIVSKLGKSTDDVADMIKAKVGVQLDKLLPVAPVGTNSNGVGNNA